MSSGISSEKLVNDAESGPGNGTNRGAESASGAISTPINRKKLAPHFVDEVSNISISPSGACRIYFNTWSTDEAGKALRVESELIMTMQSLATLAKALPDAIEQARKAQNLEGEE